MRLRNEEVARDSCVSAPDVELLPGLGTYWFYYFGDLHVYFIGRILVFGSVWANPSYEE